MGDSEVAYTTGELHENRRGHEATASYSDRKDSGTNHRYVSEPGGSTSSDSAGALKELGRDCAHDIADAAGDAMDRAFRRCFDADFPGGA